MKRVYLNQVAAAFAAEAGCAFFSGFEWDANAKTPPLPCLCMSPAVLAGKSGRAEGLLRYKLSFTLAMALPRDGSHDELWQQMERTACDLYDRYALSDEVFSASELVCTPGQDKLLGAHPTLSMKVTFTVQAGYVRHP